MGPAPQHTRRTPAALARAAIARWRYTPTERWLAARRLWFAPAEVADRLTGRHDPNLPPRYLRIVGRGEFGAVGQAYLEQMIDHAGLRPGDAVLDIGCGVGRMALPLARYLDGSARYEGFDVVPAAVRWCTGHIASGDPRFRFRAIDLANTRYRPTGRGRAEDLAFPYADAAFDFALATSVFTHLAPGALARYVAEAARVLRPGGCLFTTWFLIDADSDARIADGSARLRFTRRDAGHRTLAQRPGDAEYLVAYDEAHVRDLYARSGLAVVEPIRPGTWRGHPGASPVEQDIVVARRDRQD